MNKYQRKRSKRIKKWMNILNAKGYNVTYKQTRRRMRTLDREFNKWIRVWRYGTAPVCREVCGILSGINPRQNGLNASIYIIDETPIKGKPEMWPKDNPFMVRYLGKPWKKEESE